MGSRARRTLAVFVHVAVAGALLCAGLEGASAVRPPEHGRPATLILISLDGFRWDYQRVAPTPTLDALMARGVRAEALKPIFPTKTFPNHYSIVTGLYAEHHGVVGNSMREPGTPLRFWISSAEAVGDSRWWQGEPIWVTVTRQGRRSATLFWPGSEAAVGGVRPDDWTLYDGSIPNHERVTRILRWLDAGEERPAFIASYFSDLDDAGHKYGPDSPQVRAAIVSVDLTMRELMRGIEGRGLADRVDIVIVSDHGMAATSPKRVIVLADYVNMNDVEVSELNPNLAIGPKAGATITADGLYKRLERAHPHLRVYRREAAPERWRYKSHPRVPAIVGVADEGWSIAADQAAVPKITKNGGDHGWDSNVQSMQGVFIAAGPSFRRGAVVPAFENVHIYNALAAAIGVTPAPNDGDPAVAERLLAK